MTKVLITKDSLHALGAAIVDKTNIFSSATLSDMKTAVENCTTYIVDTDGNGIFVDDCVSVYNSTEMRALLTTDNIGNVYRYMGSTGDFIEGDFYKIVCCTNDEEASFAFEHYFKDDVTLVCSISVPGDCLMFLGESSNFTLTATNVEWDGTLEYSTDRSTWTTWDGSAISSVDQRLYLRGYNNTCFYTSNGVRFALSNKAGCYGNINTLLQYDNPPTAIPSENCFRSLFYGCINLTTAPELPATTLAYYCYARMFYGCRNLTRVPELPATTLTSRCYYSMFYGCTSLTQAPELPATTLASYCYCYMFGGCTSLTEAPKLPATTLTDHCYYHMFEGCINLTTAPELPATTLTSHCYCAMFENCTSLTQPPELPATTLAEFCYGSMFFGCTNLTQAPELPATTLGYYCYEGMFGNCVSLTQAPELPATTATPQCYCAMFSNCTSLTQAPELPATTLAYYCYSSMFYGCTNLTQAPELPATTLASYCYYYMFYGCRNLTRVPELPATTLEPDCYYAMFYGCTSLKLSATQTYEYTQEYRIPTTGTGTTADYALKAMFGHTGGTFTGTPSINTTYYLHNSCDIVLATTNTSE